MYIDIRALIMGRLVPGVSKDSLLKDEVNGKVKMEDMQQSKCSNHCLPPIPEDVLVFRRSGPKFAKLKKGKEKDF